MLIRNANGRTQQRVGVHMEWTHVHFRRRLVYKRTFPKIT